MSLDDCAQALRDHDPDRFGICLLVPAEARPKLMSLYALNLELARAPLASAEPLIAEMRLQWWIERLEEIGAGKPQAHELLTPLAEAWGPRAAAFAVLAEGRRRDAAREPLDGPDAVAGYVRGTAVPLAQFAAEALGWAAVIRRRRASSPRRPRASGWRIGWRRCRPCRGWDWGFGTLRPRCLPGSRTRPGRGWPRPGRSVAMCRAGWRRCCLPAQVCGPCCRRRRGGSRRWPGPGLRNSAAGLRLAPSR
ncbi:squalene/phytoene synthase family protein [Paracoccus binzhouensis]|uniref:squalene/phytoene synthase family protein n=1 Tax=Paracoccus binzhouensis TaxID=2796149 RepID=UPI001E5C3568|nr:squalene/phytoene synthase family protein [Paracoccus binzhouensis]